jgi:hypothetical protein
MIHTDWGNTTLAFAAITGLVIWVVYFALSMAAEGPVKSR